jgi:hypothetical protein
VLAYETRSVSLIFTGNRTRGLVGTPRFRLPERFFLTGDDVITLAVALDRPFLDAACLGLVESG